MVLDVCRSLWNQCLLYLLETTTKSMITLFGRANSQLLFFNVVTTIQLWISASDQQEPACCVCKNLHQQKWLTTTTAKMHHPLSHCAHIYCLFSRNVQQASVNVNGRHFFPAWRNSITHLCFICISMSDATMSDCSSAAICHMATTRKKILVWRFSLHHHLI